MITPFEWQGNKFWLSSQRAMYWEAKKTLVVSDLHLGKVGHFRKSGIAMPQQIIGHDLMRLVEIIQYFQPERILVVGDLVHSSCNRELDWFSRWRQDFPYLHWTLVKGNHDILSGSWYVQHDIEVVSDLQDGNLIFIHEPSSTALPEGADGQVCGHIHPGIRISGSGRQQLRLPCFYFSETTCILPAFGAFTGSHLLKPGKKDRILAIANNEIIPLF